MYYLRGVGSAFSFLPRGPEGMHETIKNANSSLQAESRRAPFKTIAWHKAIDLKMGLKASNSDAGKMIKEFISKPHKWTDNPVNAFYKSKEEVEAVKEKALNAAGMEIVSWRKV